MSNESGVIALAEEPVGFAKVRDPEEWGEYVEKLEAISLNFPQADAPVTHYFLPGLYMREVYLPAGTFAIGHAHKERCFDIILQGRGTIVMNGVLKEVQAPSVGISEPFSRKIGCIKEPMRWITVHATEETDLGKLEAELIVKSDSFLRHEAAIDATKLNRDRSSYADTLALMGVTEEQVQLVVADLSDAIDQPEDEIRSIYFFNSPIDGIGMFAARTFEIGDTICTARIVDQRTPAGRFTNHSATPNAAAVMAGGNVVYQATEKIFVGSEITLDYKQTWEATHNP